MAEVRDIKYINREFGDFKTQLQEFAKNYFSDTYNDFSEASPGMMFMEMAAYVGDVLSFYQDNQLQETFVQHAKNPQNLYSLAYMMGYRPRVTSAAEVELEVTQTVLSVAGENYNPNWDQAVFVSGSAVLSANTPNNPTFLTANSVDFKYSSSLDPTEVIANIEPGDTYPSTFTLKKKVKAFSGNINAITSSITTVERFKTINIEDTNIIRILDIYDSDGNRWYEVPYLGQDTIFVEETNTGNDRGLVRSSLALKKVPRRFVSRFTSTGVLQIQFGSGVISADDEHFIPDPTYIKKYGDADTIDQLDVAWDPTNFLFTRSYGLAPSKDLYIRYLTGGGVEANVGANTVNIKTNVPTPIAIDDSQADTLTFNNPKAASGGKDGDTVEELRENTLKSFSEQKRTVTVADYTVRALSMPSQYGSVAKVFVTKENISNSSRSVLDKNPLALSLYVLAYDVNGKLIPASDTLKQNLKTYLSQYMMITDAIDIKDAFVVNIAVKFEILTLPNYASRDVLLRCNQVVQKYFNIKNWSINQPINLSNLFTKIDQVKGVQTVKGIRIENKAGGIYSQYGYDTEGATKDGIVYPSYDPSIFEIKYPNIDIEGRVTSL